MRVLFLSSWYPWPTDNGNKIRVSGLLQALGRDHRTTLISARGPAASNPPAGTPLKAWCEKVISVPWTPRPPGGIRRFLSYLDAKPVPGWVITDESPAMRDAILHEVRSGAYDVVVANRLPTAVYGQFFGGLPALFEEVELGGYTSAFTQASSPLRRSRGLLFYWKLRRAVARLLESYTACTVVSEQERRLLKRVAPSFGPVEIIPNCLDVEAYDSIETEPQPGTLIFTGSLTFSANHEAMKFFLREVFPIVRAKVPYVCLRITGRHGGRPLPVPPSDPAVQRTGFVEDVRPLIAGSWLSVVPLLAGGGTRLKILEAMALGTPVVSTTKGAEGLEVEHGEHLLIADRAHEFAEAVIRICLDAELRRHLADQARQLVAEKYDWSAVTPRFLQLVEAVADRGRS